MLRGRQDGLEHPTPRSVGSEAPFCTYRGLSVSWSPLPLGFSFSVAKQSLFCTPFKEDINTSLPQFPLGAHAHKALVDVADLSENLGVMREVHSMAAQQVKVKTHLDIHGLKVHSTSPLLH